MHAYVGKKVFKKYKEIKSSQSYVFSNKNN